MSDSPVTIVGNCTREPELRFTPGGIAVCDLGVAVNHRRQNKQTQEWEEETSFFDCVFYGSLAENVAETFKDKGRVIVMGRLQQRSWETQEGEKRYKVELIADSAGPDLRWATADITKNEKREGGSNGSASRPKAAAAAKPRAASAPATEEPW